MKSKILGSTADIQVWPHFDPGLYVDFNPTLFKGLDKKRYALIRRNLIPPQPGISSIWAVEVDGELKPIGRPVRVIERGEDPRAVVIGNKLHIFFVQIELGSLGEALGSTVIWTQHKASHPFELERLFVMPKSPTGRIKESRLAWEKNWVPFEIHSGAMGIIYQHSPWEVLTLDVECSDAIPRLRESFLGPQLRWNFGDIRGGTVPLPYDSDHLVTFFHSSQVAGSRNIYMIGACCFRNRPPYSPVAMTTEPLFHGSYGSIAARHGWPILASVLFPLGGIESQEKYHLLIGVDDGEVGRIDINRNILESRLSSILPHDSTPLIEGKNLRAEGAQRILNYFHLYPFMDGYLLDLTTRKNLIAIDFINLFSGIISRYDPASHQLKPLWRRTRHNEESEVAAIGELATFLDKDISLIKIEGSADELARKVLKNYLIQQRPLVLVEKFSITDSHWLGVLTTDFGYFNTNMFNLNPEYQLYYQPTHLNAWPHLFS